jgi:hypothetical protein
MVANAKSLVLEVSPYKLDVHRFSGPVPDEVWLSPFVSITRAGGETSVVCVEGLESTKSERGWRALRVQGPLPFDMTGVLSSIAEPLARAEISLFAISTYDTDYILVKRLDEAISTLRAAGFEVLT